MNFRTVLAATAAFAIGTAAAQAAEVAALSGDNTVTIGRYTGGGSFSSVSGSTPEELLPYVADSVLKYHMWQLTFTTSHGNGTLRPLVVLSKTRVDSLPDVPGTEESGIAGLEGDTISGIVAPAGTPKEITKKISDAIGQGFRQADMQERILRLEATPLGSTPEQTAKRIESELAMWAKIVRDANLQQQP